MNFAAHQKKEKKEKMGKSKTEEERKQATDFKKAACCSFAVRSEGSTAKKWFV